MEICIFMGSRWTYFLTWHECPGPAHFHVKERLIGVSCGHSHVMVFGGIVCLCAWSPCDIGLTEVGNVSVWGSSEFDKIGNGESRLDALKTDKDGDWFKLESGVSVYPR